MYKLYLYKLFTTVDLPLIAVKLCYYIFKKKYKENENYLNYI